MFNKLFSISALTLLSATVVNAATISFSSGPFSATNDIFIDTGGDFSTGTPASVTGLQQFNPALGALTGVTFDITAGGFSWDASMFGEPPTQGDLFEGEFEGFIQADLAYVDGLSASVLAGVSDSINLLCSSDFGDELCEDFNSNSLDFSTDGFDIPHSIGDFDLADLIGTGDVTNLSVGVNTFGSSFLTNDGLDFVEVTGFAEASNVTVEVTYEYSVVPVPAAAWLFGSGLLGLVSLARRKRV